MPTLAAVFLALAPTLACAQGDAAAAPVVFDGRSLAGWRGDERYWSVEDGQIVGRTTAAAPLERSTYLVWEGGELRDFELTLSYRIERGNTGVQFRSRVTGEHNVSGYQADLADSLGLTGTLYEQFGRSLTLCERGERTHAAANGKLERARFAPSESFAELAREGTWHELRIRAVGPKSELFVNGVKTAELVDESPRGALSGVLALQLHSGPPMEARFKDFRLTDLGGVHDARARIEPLWIWSHGAPEPGEEAWFQRTLELPGPARRAILYATADDAFEAYLDGELVAAGHDATRTQQVDVTTKVQAGVNVLSLWARNVDGPAALLCGLQVEGDGWQRAIFTDGAWRGARAEPENWLQAGDDPRWGGVHAYGPVGTEPWMRPANQVKHAPLAALPASEITLPDGFEAELLYSVPRARQGSWVALCSDGRNSLYASDQHGALYRYPISTGLVEKVDVPLGEAQGLCWAEGALYAVVNRAERYASGLYRVTDSDGDDRLDRVELLRAFEGNDEHGPHGVVYSWFEDVLYVVGGNESLPPEEALAEWGPSYLPVGRLPAAVQEVDVTQFELAEQGLSGWIARTDRDGKRWELVAMGLRNAYDLVVTRHNQLYSFDSDMEWDLGLPWYVPTRLVNIVPRADFGFRLGSARWPTWFPDSPDGVVDVGRTSPTGMLAAYELDFPEEYGNVLLAGDWLKGRILAFDPEAGGSWNVEVFASGKPLPVTDLAVGPDGALYFTTGGRHAQSGLYRVRPLNPSPPRPTGGSFTRLYGELDGYRSSKERAKMALGGTWRVNVSRAAFESQPLSEWIDLVTSERDPRIRAQLELALARVGPPERVRDLLGRLAALPLDPADIEGTLLRLRTLELALLRAEGVSGATRAELAETLLAVFPIGSRDADRQLGVLLASLPEAAEAFVPRALARLAAADAAGDGAEAFHWAFVLRVVERGWTPEGRQQQFAWLCEAERSFGGGRAVPVFLAALRRDALATLTAAEREALGELVEPAVEDALAPANPRPFVQAWTVADLEPRLAEVEGERDLVRGQALLRDAACLSCHRIEGRGTALGPELDGLAGRFNAADLLESILEPSRAVPERYRDTIVWTHSGRAVAGRIVEEKDGVLYLRGSSGARELAGVPLDEIESRETSRLSTMPEGLLDSFTAEEILDLLAYLLQGG